MDETAAAAQQKRDLPFLQAALRQLCTARKCGDVVGHRSRRVMHDGADLGRGLALQRQSHDLYPMGEHRSDIVHHTAQRNRRLRLLSPQLRQVARYGARRREENPVGQVFACQQRALAQRLLAQIRQPSPAERRGALPLQQRVIFAAAM